MEAIWDKMTRRVYFRGLRLPAALGDEKLGSSAASRRYGCWCSHETTCNSVVILGLLCVSIGNADLPTQQFPEQRSSMTVRSYARSSDR